MNIGIIVAMEKELALLLPLLENPHTVNAAGFTFHTGTISNSPISVMKCGIGKVNAALGTDAMISAFHPDLIINTGVAGGTGHGAGILDIVVGTRIAYHDVWCGPGTEKGQAAGCPRVFHTSETVNSLPCLHEGDTIKHGLICSGDVFVADPETVRNIRNIYPDVNAVDMESAAIAHTCYLRRTPFACLRVVSDTPGSDDNISQYENFWTDAPQHTFETLRMVITQLTDGEK